MRLLIAGWQGQLARALVELVPGRDDVTSFAVGRPALDLCEQPTIQRAMSEAKPDIVINAAAYTAVDKAESEPAAAFALNRDGPGMLAKAAAARDVPIIHISTDYVFDGQKTGPYTETDATGPQSVYGRSKLEGEHAVAAANPRHLILRTAWVHSPTGNNFVKTMLRLAGERDELSVVADQQGSPTYAPHLADVILDTARAVTGREANDPAWGIYHATGTGATSWHGFACEIMTLAGAAGAASAPVRAITTAEFPTAAARPANSVMDCAKLKEAFGLALPRWQDGAKACVARLLDENNS